MKATGGKSSQRKGKRGMDLHAKYVTEQGYGAIRGPNVDQWVFRLNGVLHFEVKRVERQNLHEALAQAQNDKRRNGASKPVVALKRSYEPWKYFLWGDDFWDIWRRRYLEGVAAGYEAGLAQADMPKGDWDGSSR